MFSTSSALVVIRRAHSPGYRRRGRLTPVGPFFYIERTAVTVLHTQQAVVFFFTPNGPWYPGPGPGRRACPGRRRPAGAAVRPGSRRPAGTAPGPLAGRPRWTARRPTRPYGCPLRPA